MTIKGFDEAKFRSVLKLYLTPARAISSPQHLKGRERVLTQIDRAFNSPGKHVFIHGDRGVGKTSLAQTAAHIQQSSDGAPVLVSCGGSSFLRTVRDAVKRALIGDPLGRNKLEHKFKAGVGALSYERAKSISAGEVPEIESVNDAAMLLELVAKVHSQEPVIILDEFDQMTDSGERKLCADILKKVSDDDINVKFILCGIGRSLEDLIGVHLSTGRYISPVALERLSHEARWEIIHEATNALGVTIGANFLLRISQISDGFPSYVHLMGEQILWAMFDDERPCGHCSQEHFANGVRRAVSEAETTLKIIYEKATQKYLDDYEEVLWALADKHVLRRQTTDIYEKSYVPIMEERTHRKTLTKAQFSGRLNNLKSSRHGEIIVASGAGWFEFNENVVRGYVRLRAEQEGVQIGSEGYA